MRDTALNKEDDGLPESDVGKEYQLNRMAKDGELGSSYSQEQPNDTILLLQRPAPYYKVLMLTLAKKSLFALKKS